MRILDFWCPNNHSTQRHNQAASLRLFVCTMALVIGASIEHGQPTPDTILLPDSLGPLHPGYHLAFGSSTNNIYVASESSDIIVVDGNTFQRIKRIITGTPVGGALLVAQHNRLYCSYPTEGRIGVIDCATNSIVDSIQVGTRPTLLCYSSGSDKLYCGDTIDRTVSVIDCTADTVRKVIPVGRSLTALAYDPTADKVYAATRDAVLGISCPADSVVATISEVKAARGLCVNKRRQKLYVVGRQYVYPDTMYVISTGADSLVAKLLWNCDPHLACNELTDRLYGVDNDGGGVRELDCTRDTLVRYRSLGGYISMAGLFCDTVRNRLYYLYEDDDYRGRLFVFDCTTLDVISETQVEDYPAILESDPVRSRVMCAGGRWEGVLSVFDCKHDSLDAIGFVPLCGWRWDLCHNPVAGKLYYRWGDGAGGVGVVDEQTNRVVAQIVLPQKYGYRGVGCSRKSNKLYFEVVTGLAVVDGAGDSLLKLVDLGGSGSTPFWSPDSNKLYCFVDADPRWYIAVLDCHTDSVVREIDAYHGVGTFMLLNESLLLGAREDGLTLIDCQKDSVLIDTTTPGNIYAVAHSGDDKVYIVHHYSYDRLEVLDAGSLSLRTSIDWSYGGAGANPFLVCSDSTDKLYWFAWDGSASEPDSVLVIDTRSDSVVARLCVGFRQVQGCVDHSGRYIFNPNPENGFTPDTAFNRLIIYDTQSDSVAAVYEDLPGPLSAISNPERRCVYVGCTDVILVYPDAPPGVEEMPNAEVRATNDGPTVVKRVLVYAPTNVEERQAKGELLDASGRKAMNLRPGENDVRALPPGVYFVRGTQAQVQAQVIRKVVIAR